MSTALKSLIIAFILTIASLPTVSSAYHCGWHNGHHVCWQQSTRHCKWVNGHWYRGHYYQGHHVCWYRR